MNEQEATGQVAFLLIVHIAGGRLTERLGVRRRREQQSPRHPAAQLQPM